MDRKMCEERIKEKLMEIMEVYLEYAPEGTSVSMCINPKSGFINANNAYWKTGEDNNWPINISEFTKEEEE